MLAVGLQAGGQLQGLVFVHTFRGHQVGKAGLAQGKGAGFVEGHYIDLVRHFQGLCVFDQDAVAGRHARARHDGGRCGQAQCAGAGNHQHGHGVEHRHLQRCPPQPPASQGGQRNQQHHGHEHGGYLVHQPLHGWFGGLGILHQRDDAVERALCAHGLHAHLYSAFTVQAAAGDGIAHGFGHGHAFAGQHGFIGLGLALDDVAIRREAFAGAHHHRIAGQQFGHGHIGFVEAAHAIGQQVGHIGPQALQRPDGRGGLAAGLGFQPLAQQHQGDDHRRALEIHMHHAARFGGQPQPGGQAPARRGADGHQQFHVAAASFDGMPGRCVKHPAQPELDGRGQHKLHPRRQHPVLAEGIAQHGQHQGHAQHQPDQDGPEIGAHAHPHGGGGFGGRSVRGTGLVARIAHRSGQAGLHFGLAASVVCQAVPLHPCRFGGQVDAGAVHAGNFFQDPLDTGHARGAGHAAYAEIQRTQVRGGGLTDVGNRIGRMGNGNFRLRGVQHGFLAVLGWGSHGQSVNLLASQCGMQADKSVEKWFIILVLSTLTETLS